MIPETLNLFKTTPGAISVHEALAIEWLSAQAPEGIRFDLGTNAGKAAICQASGIAKNGEARDIYCIDTVFDLENDEAWQDNKMQPDRNTTGWAWIYELDFKDKVRARIRKASEGLAVPYIFGESVLTGIPRLSKPGIAFAFSDADSANQWLVSSIADALALKMISGGIIAWHDWNSQFIPPKEASDRLIATGDFEQVEIPWDEIQTTVDALGGEHGGNNSWHHNETPRPMFVGAIRRK